MDTTIENIKKCEKAVEIQGKHVKDELDIFFHDGYVKTIASKLPGCTGTGRMIERVNFRYVSDLRPKEWNDYCIWLPRQDQLQEMIFDKRWTLRTFLDEFEYYRNSPDRLGEILMESMEQLWLGFVMKKKFNKVWDGKDWIIN